MSGTDTKLTRLGYRKLLFTGLGIAVGPEYVNNQADTAFGSEKIRQTYQFMQKSNRNSLLFYCLSKKITQKET